VSDVQTKIAKKRLELYQERNKKWKPYMCH
jgi:hypothetical protein